MSVLSTPVFLLWQVFNQDSDERVDALFEKLNEAIKKGDVSVVGAFADMLKRAAPRGWTTSCHTYRTHHCHQFMPSCERR